MQYARSVRAAAVAALWCCGAAFGQTGQTQGPDVIVGDLPDLTNGSSDIAPVTINGVSYKPFAVGTTSCNKGNVPLNWWTGGTDNRHPAISQNVYRYSPSTNRFEQLAQGQLKDGFTALQGGTCTSYFGFPCTSTAGTTLGTGCSDPYSSGLNNVTGSGAPKWQVNAATGLFPYPYTAPTNSGPPRVRMSDLNNAPSGSRYFIEGQYICGDDAAAGNKNNNASWREIQFAAVGTPPNATNFTVAFSTGTGGVVHREQPAVYAWQAIDPTVVIRTADVPGDGRFVVACKVTGPTGGLYTYEYAVHNLNSHRCGGSFTVPLPASHNALTAAGFHDAELVGGEPNATNAANPSSDDWTMAGGSSSDSSVVWSGPAYAGTPPVYVLDPATPYKVASFTAGTGNDHSANVLRWGTLFNFRFTSELAPGSSGSVAIGLWRPGNGTGMLVSNVPTPGGATIGTAAACCNGTTCSVGDPAACTAGGGTLAYASGLLGTTCTPDPCVAGTCCTLGACSPSTFLNCAGNWTAGGSCSPNPCPQPTGACCPSGTTTCSVTTSAGCAGGWQGANTTCSSAPCPPVNDPCSGAIAVNAGVSVSGSTIAATYAAADGTATCGASGSTPDIWYKYVPATSGSVTFALCGSSYDTVLSIHTGSCGALAQLNCNDDSCNLQSSITQTVTAGTLYYIRVSGYSGATGTTTLLVTGGGGSTGACCAASGACSAVTQASCPSGYQGDATVCSPNPCPQPPSGACCTGTTCAVGTQAACSGSFQGASSACGTQANPTTCCPANYNQTGGITVADIFDFLNDWFNGLPGADFNHQGGINVQDIFDFLAAWFTGC